MTKYVGAYDNGGLFAVTFWTRGRRGRGRHVWYLHEFVTAVVVVENADVHGQYRQQDAGQGHGREFVDELHAHVDDRAHDHQQYRPVHAEIVVHYAAVFGEVAENR